MLDPAARPSPPQMPQQHVILSTHTTLHLAACLRGFGLQSRPPDSVTLSCDVLSPEIAEVARDSSARTGLEILLVQRPHTGKARCGQVRNNAVRALMGEFAPPGDARLVFLDADTVPGRDCLRQHESLGGTRGLVSTFRVNLTPAQTRAFDFDRLARGEHPVPLAPAQSAELNARHARYRRQLLWRKLGLGKSHKPRLIGGHFSVPLAAYVGANGTDEAYEGYGQEDDDLARRLNRAGWPSVVAVREIPVYHLYHPTRAPAAWDTAPGVVRFKEATPVRTVLGLDRPAPQPAVSIGICRDGRLEPRSPPGHAPNDAGDRAEQAAEQRADARRP